MINRNNDAVITNYSGQHLGNYRLLHLLGRGGSAAVYLGVHIYLNRLAAIKVMRTVLGEQGRARFLEEARLLAGLSHPFIVRVLEFDVLQNTMRTLHRQVEQSIPYFIMDFVPGGSLRARYPAGSCLFLDTVTNYIKQVAAPLQYAHDQGVIHRDIKPENLLLNERQEVMLSDFGLALLAPTPETLSLQDMVGSLPYSAPEQLRGKPHFASDQYSLAILAYEWLCGHRPFQGEDIEIVMQHISSSPPSLQEAIPTLSPSVEEVILKALAKEPQQRFPTILAFAQALQRAGQVQSFGFSSYLPAASKPWPFVSSSNMRVQEDEAARSMEQASHSVQVLTPNAPLIQVQSVSERMRMRYMTSSSMYRNRQRLIYKVRSFWIDGVLERALHNSNLITLELGEASYAVEQPWHLSLYQGEKHIRSLASGTSITQIYDQMHGEVLILGEAGSGKTTLLLQLARALLDHAEHDDASPVPVIFPLSSWSSQRLPLELWLVEELYRKYQVPSLLGQEWIRNEVFVPLLDGLDEVIPNARPACIAAINMYKKEHGFNPLVVCSRLREYMLDSPRVLLESAIIIQPLTATQVERYLLRAGGELTVIHQLLQDDLFQQPLVMTPLMLSIIANTFRGRSLEAVLVMQISASRYQYILNAYVQEMLRRYMTTSYDPEKVIHWLSNLAKHMQMQNQTIVYLEQLQPVWIHHQFWRKVYLWLAVWLPGIGIGLLVEILTYTLFVEPGDVRPPLLDGLFGPLIGYLISRRMTRFSDIEDTWQTQKHPLLRGGDLVAAFSFALTTWYTLGNLTEKITYSVLSFFLCIVLTLSSQKRTRANAGGIAVEKHQLSRAKYPLQKHLRTGLFVAFLGGLMTTILSMIAYQNMCASIFHLAGKGGPSMFFARVCLPPTFNVHYDILSALFSPSPNPVNTMVSQALSVGLHAGLSNGLLAGALSFLLMKQDGTIRPAEIVAWSWKAFWDGCRKRKNIFSSILIGGIATFIYAFLKLPLYGGIQGLFHNVSAISLLLADALANGLVIGTGSYLIGATLQAISRHNLSDQYRFIPNEGIWRSLRYSLLASVIGACISGLFYIFAVTPAIVINALLVSVKYHQNLFQRTVLSGWSVSLSWHNGLFISFIGAILALLLLGGLAFLQHTLLRLILWRTGVLPLNTPRFLDHAVSSILMHKVGGGYMFIHHLLLEYFSSLNER